MFLESVTINGVQKTIQPGWTIDTAANGHSTMTFDLASFDEATRPSLDQIVSVADDGTEIFGGLISALSEAGLGGHGTTEYITRVTALDYNQYPERRYVFDYFPAGTLKSQLTQLLSWATGGTLHPDQVDGPMMPALTYDGVKAVDVLNDFTLQSGGYLWENDFQNRLRMWAREEASQR